MAVETTRKLKMTFKTVNGDDKNVALNYVKEGLTTGEGAALVKTAVNAVLAQQPFNEQVTRCDSAKEIVTNETDVELD